MADGSHLRGLVWSTNGKWEVLAEYLPKKQLNTAPLVTLRRNTVSMRLELWVFMLTFEDSFTIRYDWQEVPNVLDRMEAFLRECQSDPPKATLQAGIIRRFELLRDNIVWTDPLELDISHLQLLADLKSGVLRMQMGHEPKKSALTLDDFADWLKGLRAFVTAHSKV